MQQDRWGYDVSTASQAATDAYVEGIDLFLSAQPGAENAFGRAIAADDSFSLAHAALARLLQVMGRPAEAADAISRAKACGNGLSAREQGHLAVLGHLIGGNGPAAYAAVLDHVVDYPRDSLIVQPCCGVLGLIGFSGRAGRQAEQLAFLATLAPHYGEEWWFETQYAFAQIEAGQIEPGRETLDRAFTANRSNANAAHIHAHLQYESGEAAAGRADVASWRKDYDRTGLYHCHLAWHEALWALADGETELAWRIAETDVWPGAAWGPPINVLTDSAAFLLRAEIAGEARNEDLWRDVCRYASTFFPNPGVSFADAHAAIAHAMVGDDEALAKLREKPGGFAGDLVSALADVYAAFVRSDWQAVVGGLTPVLASHERLGGSRAQRDFLELTMVSALLKLGRGEEASRHLMMRRPISADTRAIAGLHDA